MNFYLDQGPIIACSTGTTSNTAIAIIRLSGFKSLFEVQSFFSLDINSIKPRYAHLTNLLHNCTVIDNILLTFFPANSSYNGENIIELSVHGNQLNISRIIDIFVSSQSFRIAGPGEFSYRALKNGKLSLSQVEGLDMLLNANSSLMLDQGLEILQGELHQKYMALYDSFLKLKAAIEISIDFSDDVGEAQTKALFQSSLTSFREILFSLYARTRSSVSSLMSPDIVISGETNAGKSSLFNLLLKHNRSIVSAIPGTTRDYISEFVTISGVNFRLVDTAGIRDSEDVIEAEGIDRAFEVLSTAFYKILVIDPHNFNKDYLLRLKDISFDLVIFSHSDSSDFLQNFQSLNFDFIKSKYFLAASFMSGSIGPFSNLTFGPIEPLLKNEILCKFEALSANNPILLDRHRSSIAKIYTKFIYIERDLSELSDVAIISSEINILALYLSELVGIVSPDDVLNSIFSNFCIGK